MKSSYSYIKGTWENADKVYMRDRVRKWKAEEVISRIDKPTKLGRARALGYKAKQGYVMVRIRIRKSGRKRRTIRKGRRPTNVGIVNFTTSMSKQSIAEKRTMKKFPNMEVLNSYKAGEDGRNHYFEVILVDPAHSSVKKDSKISWISGKRNRASRGLTSSMKKNRGLS